MISGIIDSKRVVVRIFLWLAPFSLFPCLVNLCSLRRSTTEAIWALTSRMST